MVAALLLVLWAVPGPASAELEPLIRGWERFFKISWEAWERNGQAVVGGYIANGWGFPAMKLRLLVEGLDGSGRVVTQEVGWLGTALTPGMTAYFEVPVRQRSSRYRVSVFAFDWVQAASLQAP
jgi:hypothetical protein